METGTPSTGTTISLLSPSTLDKLQGASYMSRTVSACDVEWRSCSSIDTQGPPTVTPLTARQASGTLESARKDRRASLPQERLVYARQTSSTSEHAPRSQHSYEKAASYVAATIYSRHSSEGNPAYPDGPMHDTASEPPTDTFDQSFVIGYMPLKGKGDGNVRTGRESNRSTHASRGNGKWMSPTRTDRLDGSSQRRDMKNMYSSPASTGAYGDGGSVEETRIQGTCMPCYAAFGADGWTGYHVQ